MASSASYNFTVHEESPLFTYSPVRDTDPSQGWNSSYSGDSAYTLNNLVVGMGGGKGGGFGTGIPYRRTQYNGASVSFSFEGTALYLCLTAPEGSSYSFTVDLQTLDKAGDATADVCTSYAAETILIADGLTYGSHTVTLIVSIADPSVEFLFFGGVVTMSAGPDGYTVSDPLYVNTSDSDWEWEPADGSGWGNTNSFTSGAISSQLRWTCAYGLNNAGIFTVPLGTTALQLLGLLTPDASGYTVSLDDQSAVYNATNFWFSTDQVMFLAGGLDPTHSYTLSVSNYDATDGLVGTAVYGASCLYIDAIMLFQSVPSADSNLLPVPIVSTSMILSTSSGLPTVSRSLPTTFSSATSSLETGSALTSSAMSTLVFASSVPPGPSATPDLGPPTPTSRSPGILIGAVIGTAAAMFLAIRLVCFFRRGRRLSLARPWRDTSPGQRPLRSSKLDRDLSSVSTLPGIELGAELYRAPSHQRQDSADHRFPDNGSLPRNGRPTGAAASNTRVRTGFSLGDSLQAVGDALRAEPRGSLDPPPIYSTP